MMTKSRAGNPAIRLSGLAAAVVAGTCLILIVAEAAGPASMVMPTNGVTDGGRADNPAGAGTRQALAERALMQRWRGDYLPAGDASEAAGAAETATPSDQGDLENMPSDQIVATWRANRAADESILVREDRTAGVSSLPGPVKNVFVQPEGRDWRRLHNGEVTYGGGIVLFGALLALALFLFARGRIRVKEGLSGSTIERFSAFERANHWMTAAGFVVAGLTGLILLYGRYLVRPWLGADSYDDVAEASAWLHMIFIVPFVIGVFIMIGIWTWQNLPDRLDWVWLKRFGGFLDDEGGNPPARRFNAGQKLIFWSVVLGGLALLATGLALMFPFFLFGYDGMQWAQLAHAAIGLVMVAVIFGHIYIGTIGMQGAFDAMWSGRVDRNWAREHHSIWYREKTGEKETAA